MDTDHRHQIVSESKCERVEKADDSLKKTHQIKKRSGNLESGFTLRSDGQ